MQRLNPVFNSPRLRLLIVDDMPQVRQELCLLLQVTGELEVVGEAINGLDAIQQAESLRPDVVLMDLEMPVMDGCEATIQIKERQLAKKVIILTIHAGDEIAERIQRSGADEYIQKGVSFEILIRTITG
jgi:DNA-binding NarL/FixJ family response regulator